MLFHGGLKSCERLIERCCEGTTPPLTADESANEPRKLRAFSTGCVEIMDERPRTRVEAIVLLSRCLVFTEKVDEGMKPA